MVQLCFALLLLGIMCLIVEMFMPGFGVFGISGIVLMVISGVLAVIYVPYGWFIVAAEGALLTVMFIFMTCYIRRRQLHGRLIMNENLNEDMPPIGDLESLIGKEGVTVTVLRPFGAADFNGVRMEVSSCGPFIEKGVRITVSQVEKNKITVSAKNTN
jgi:membrane-bound serine protease (ClpP class)